MAHYEKRYGLPWHMRSSRFRGMQLEPLWKKVWLH